MRNIWLTLPAGLLAGLLGLLPAAAAAQGFPSRPVRIIVPSPPGGAIDLNGRVLAAKLQDYWGQSVVVENRAGASMIIGAEAAARRRRTAIPCWWRTMARWR